MRTFWRSGAVALLALTAWACLGVAAGEEAKKDQPKETSAAKTTGESKNTIGQPPVPMMDPEEATAKPPEGKTDDKTGKKDSPKDPDKSPGVQKTGQAAPGGGCRDGSCPGCPCAGMCRGQNSPAQAAAK